MTEEQRIEVYKQAAMLLMNKSFTYQEMPLLANVTNYLAQEIENHERSEASADTGTQGEAPVL